MAMPPVANFESRPLNDEQLQRVKDNVKAATALFETITRTPHSRERSVAITKLEEVVMWANKAISREEN